LLTLRGSVIVGIDSGMYWVVQVRVEGSSGNQLASLHPNTTVVLESPGPNLKALPALGAKAGGKAQPQTGVVAKSPTASAVFTGIPAASQTLMIQATGISPVEGVVISVTGPKTYTAGPPLPPCCAITAINRQTAIVTARVHGDAQIFSFLVQGVTSAQPQTHEGPPPRPVPVIGTLTIGQPVWANLTTGQVSLDGKTPCCQITAEGIPSSSLDGKPTVGIKSPIATSPACCEITALSQQAKTVTAKVKSNGQAFQIAVVNPTVFQSLRVGQAIWANFQTRQVSLNGLGPVDGMQVIGSKTGGPVIAHVPGVIFTGKKPPYTAIPSPSSPPLSIHDHTLIMQAVIQNRAYLAKEISQHNWQHATKKQLAIGAMLYLLKSSAVPEATKERIRVALQTVRTMRFPAPRKTGLGLRNEVTTAVRTAKDPSSAVQALSSLEQKYQRQPRYVTALTLGKNLIHDGNSTIYSRAWLRQQGSGGVTTHADVLGCADSSGISEDCLGGGGGSPFPCPDPTNPACNSCPDPTNPSCSPDCTTDPNNPACGTDCASDPTNPACNSCPDPNNPACGTDCTTDPSNPACSTDCASDPTNPACNSCPDPTNPACGPDCTADPNNPACSPFHHACIDPLDPACKTAREVFLTLMVADEMGCVTGGLLGLPPGVVFGSVIGPEGTVSGGAVTGVEGCLAIGTESSIEAAVIATIVLGTMWILE
jgi:hypothetical protein